jgi:ribosome silencing factor RsfS/YbeB/iojap
MTDPQATSAKRNIAKLQKAIVDGLENVKAQDLQVFDTEHITSLFERVIVASGTSNRQTKALAASVRDSVRQAGFDKPRIEGEDNGEWIIVDCGAAVAHIMQPFDPAVLPPGGTVGRQAGAAQAGYRAQSSGWCCQVQGRTGCSCQSRAGDGQEGGGQKGPGEGSRKVRACQGAGGGQESLGLASGQAHCCQGGQEVASRQGVRQIRARQRGTCQRGTCKSGACSTFQGSFGTCQKSG